MTSPSSELQWTTITCVSDNDGFAREVYDYLYLKLEKQKEFSDSKDIQVSKEMITLLDDSKEIRINHNTLIPMGMIKWILRSFLESDPARFKDHDVIELGDSFTIGSILDPSKMEMFTCEICGFFYPHEEELYTHRTTHFGI
jgi:hypothetical protein